MGKLSEILGNKDKEPTKPKNTKDKGAATKDDDVDPGPRFDWL